MTSFFPSLSTCSRVSSEPDCASERMVSISWRISDELAGLIEAIVRMSGCELLRLEGVDWLRVVENGYRNVVGRQFGILQLEVIK